MTLLDRAFEVVLDQYVAVVLKRLCTERQQSCKLQVKCLAEGEFSTERMLEAGAGEMAFGEARIVLRSGFRTNSVKVQLKAVIRGLAPATGFSGFFSEGRIEFHESGELLKLPTVFEYNRWSFLPPFDSPEFQTMPGSS